MSVETSESMEVMVEMMKPGEPRLAAKIWARPRSVSPGMSAVGSFADRRTGRKIRKQDHRHKDRKPAHDIDMVGL